MCERKGRYLDLPDYEGDRALDDALIDVVKGLLGCSACEFSCEPRVSFLRPKRPKTRGGI